MELVTLGLVVAKFGAEQVVGAILGEAGVDLGRELTGILTGVERAEQRLVVIESKLDVLIDQAYTVAMGTGLRQLTQAFIAGRDPARRRADLDLAQHNLLQATQAATTKLQQARAERLLVLTQIAAGDQPAAQATWTRLDASIGDACAEASGQIENSRDQAELAVCNQHPGWRGATLSHGRRWDLIREHVARIEARVGDLYAELCDLLQDSIQIGRLLGQADVIIGQERTVRTDSEYNSGESSAGSGVVVEVPWGKRVKIGGATVRMRGPGEREPSFYYSNGNLAIKDPHRASYIEEYHATVRLSPQRTRGGSITILDHPSGTWWNMGYPREQVLTGGEKAHLSFRRPLDVPSPPTLAVVVAGMVIVTHPVVAEITPQL